MIDHVHGPTSKIEASLAARISEDLEIEEILDQIDGYLQVETMYSIWWLGKPLTVSSFLFTPSAKLSSNAFKKPFSEAPRNSSRVGYISLCRI